MATAEELAPVTRVALVEDDRETRARIAESIRLQPSLRLEAEYATGADALAALESRAPDVLLVDLELPDISGLEVVRFAAARHPECDILVISIFGDEANVLAALEAGARGYLLKGSLQIGVTDNGIGFDEAGATPGRGLESLRQRARGLGAAVEIRSSPGAGTNVTLRLPLAAGLG